MTLLFFRKASAIKYVKTSMTVEPFDSQDPLKSANKVSNNIADQTIILETTVKVLVDQSKVSR